MSAETAPLSSARMVLSEPPNSTTESSGSAFTISSTSIDIRLRSSIEVGKENASCSETVGKTNGRPPASLTPRAIASASCGAVRRHGLKSDAVGDTPTTGRSSAAAVMPAPLRKPRRRNRAKSSSPYWARRDRRPRFIDFSPKPRRCRWGESGAKRRNPPATSQPVRVFAALNPPYAPAVAGDDGSAVLLGQRARSVNRETAQRNRRQIYDPPSGGTVWAGRSKRRGVDGGARAARLG